MFYSFIVRNIINKCEKLSKEMICEKNLLKKYLRLIEDAEISELSENQMIMIQEMKIWLKKTCWKSFQYFREATLCLRKTVLLKSEVNSDSSLLCCLPLEIFDQYLSDDPSTFTLNLLKVINSLKFFFYY